MATQNVTSRVIWTIILAVPAGTIGYVVREVLAVWGILDPLAKQMGKWLDTHITAAQIGWTIATILAVAAYVFALWLVLRRRRSPQATTDDTAWTNSGTEARFPDTPIWKAIHYVSLAIGESYDSQCWPKTRQAMRQKAIAGFVRMCGRKKLKGKGIGSATHTFIDGKYWSNYEIDFMATSPAYIDSYHTKHEAGENGNEYWSLLVDMEEICRGWPVDASATISAGEVIEALEWAFQKEKHLIEIHLRDHARIGRLRSWGRRIRDRAISFEIEPLEQLSPTVWSYTALDSNSYRGQLPTNSLRYAYGENEPSGPLYEAVRFNRKEIAELCLAESI